MRASPNAIVTKARQHDREAWHADDLYSTPNAVTDAGEIAGCSEACSSFLIKVRALAFHLDDQGLVDRALQAKPANVLQVAYGDRIKQDVHNIGIVPNAFGS